MSKDIIKQLLSKGKLTGKEIGTLSMLSSINRIRAWKTKKLKGEIPPPAVSASDIDNAINKIRDNAHELEIYNSYIGLENLATHLYSFLLAYTQQIQNGLYRVMLALTVDLWRYDKNDYGDNLPLIMTEEQFKEDTKISLDIYRAGEASYYNLFFMALNYHTSMEPEKSLIGKIYKNYAGKLVEDETLIKLYKEKHIDELEGYYTLSDGRDTREVTIEEFIEDLYKQPLLKKLKVADKAAIRERYYYETKACTGESSPIAVLKDINEKSYNEMMQIAGQRTPDSKAEVMRVYEFFELIRKYYKNQEDKEDFIADLKQLEADHFITTYKVDKQDIIINPDFIEYLYEDDADNAETLELYLKELPELEEILNKDMAEKLGVKSIDYYEADKGKKAKKTNYFKPLITYEDLYNKNIYNFKNNALWYFQRMRGEQARNNGIAIVQEETLFKDYKEKHFKEGVYTYSNNLGRYPEMFKSLAVKNDGNLETVINDYVIDGFKNTYAILTLLEDIEDIHNLEGLKEAYGFKISDIEAQAMLFNFFMWDIKTRENTPSNDMLVASLEDNAAYINFMALKPSKEARERARSFISDIKQFRGAGHKINMFLSLYFDSDATQPNAEVI